MTPETILYAWQMAIGFACTYLAINFVGPLLFRVPFLNRGQAPNSFIDNGGPVVGFIFAVAVFAAGFGLDYVLKAVAAVHLPTWFVIQTNYWANHAVSIAFASLCIFLVADLFSAKTKVYVSGLGAAFVIAFSDSVMTIGAQWVNGNFVIPSLIQILQSAAGV